MDERNAVMPSPFPGMDPYLEEPRLWPDVHHELISDARAILNKRLRPRYFVRIEERVYVSDEFDPGREFIIPDLRIAGPKRGRPMAGIVGRRNGKSTAGAAVADPIEITSLLDDEIHEARLEVVDAADKHIVTVIEFVSPTNKAAGSRGRESYVDKRREVMSSPSHFVEIDLLRGGTPIYPRSIVPAHEYLVHVSRRVDPLRRRGFVWPIRLDQRLPEILIPLRGNDSDAKLDLQAVLSKSYERGAYDLAVDYGRPAVPPLKGEWAKWARRILTARRKRG
jgi:Protein of unknown function (DUF4058)